ncbi:MAG: winged helix-turn-helix domain-containing protein [Candidatus Thorarchaeota archaeon]|jgi:DNA-binding transcriptional ArsR family regulator
MNSDEVFEAISHPMRVEILKELAKGPRGFADLKRRLKISSSGLLDFHLKKMASILTNNTNGSYILNDRGYAAVQAVDVVSKYGWQRRAYFINVGMYIVMNAYLVLTVQHWAVFIVFGIWTAWIVFYSYWTFVKRRVRLRNNGKSKTILER